MKKRENDEMIEPIIESGTVTDQMPEEEVPKEPTDGAAEDETSVENAGDLTPDDNDSKTGKEEENETVTEETAAEPDLEQLLAEAEARGYERGRNEGIEAWMNEGRRVHRAERDDAPEGEVMILNNMRRSVWE